MTHNRFSDFHGVYTIIHTAWIVSKYRVFSGPYFPVFVLNTEIYGVNLRIQCKYKKIRTRKNSVFGHFSHSDKLLIPISLKLFVQSIQPSRVQVKWFKNKLQQQYCTSFREKQVKKKETKRKTLCETLA